MDFWQNLPLLQAPGPTDLSVWKLIIQSSAVALLILIVLLFMSFVSLAILINKVRQYREVSFENGRFLAAFRRRTRLAETYGKCSIFKRSPLAKLLEAGFGDLQTIVTARRSENHASGNPGETSEEVRIKLDERDLDAISKTLEKTANEQIGYLEKMVVFLATTGNVAPFLGLLGTCWGIMRAFLNIGGTGSASLAVVAPGIAEALIATIIGLGAAIPAVIGYNWCNNKLKFIADDLNNFSLEFLSAVQKENSF